MSVTISNYDGVIREKPSNEHHDLCIPENYEQLIRRQHQLERELQRFVTYLN